MKKTIFVLVIVLVLTFAITLTASATQPTYFSGFFYPASPPFDFCFATGTPYTLDGFMYGCGEYIIDLADKPGKGGHTAIWEGWIGGNFGTCVIHVLSMPSEYRSHVTMNQCTGDLVGFHAVADGDLTNFTWDGWYHWENTD